MVESVRQRIKDAGGILTVWAVLDEDVYEITIRGRVLPACAAGSR